MNQKLNEQIFIVRVYDALLILSQEVKRISDCGYRGEVKRKHVVKLRKSNEQFHPT